MGPRRPISGIGILAWKYEKFLILGLWVYAIMFMSLFYTIIVSAGRGQELYSYVFGLKKLIATINFNLARC